MILKEKSPLYDPGVLLGKRLVLSILSYLGLVTPFSYHLCVHSYRFSGVSATGLFIHSVHSSSAV